MAATTSPQSTCSISSRKHSIWKRSFGCYDASEISGAVAQPCLRGENRGGELAQRRCHNLDRGKYNGSPGRRHRGVATAIAIALGAGSNGLAQPASLLFWPRTWP